MADLIRVGVMYFKHFGFSISHTCSDRGCSSQLLSLTLCSTHSRLSCLLNADPSLGGSP